MRNTKIGDLFAVNIGNNKRKFFQYIVSDVTQLNSDVIRVFKKQYDIDHLIDLSDIVDGEVEFYAHCITKLGMQMGLWEKIGNIRRVGSWGHVLFRDTNDYGNPSVKVSNKWWIWKINEPQIYVGPLQGVNRDAEIGVVFNPLSVVDRIKTGKYSGFYPAYE